MRARTMQSHTLPEGASVEACAGTIGAIGGGVTSAALMMAAAAAGSHDARLALALGVAATGVGTIGVKALRDAWERSGCHTIVGATVGAAIVSGSAAYVYYHLPAFLK